MAVMPGDEDRAGDGGAERGAEVGHAARQARDLALLLFVEAGLHDVDRRGEHQPDAEADHRRPGTKAHTLGEAATMARKVPMPTAVTAKPAMMSVRWAYRLASRPAASEETRSPTVAAVKMTPVWIAS